MRILFVFNHPAPYKVNLLNGLAQHHEIDALLERYTNNNRPDDFYYLNEFKFPHHFIKGIYLGEENHFGFRLKNYIKKHHLKYDLIIMNGYSTFSELIAILYMIRKNIKYHLYVNGGIIKNDHKFKKLLKTRLISSADGYFSPSIKTDEYLIHYGAKKEKIKHYIYSTIFEKDISSCMTKDELTKLKLQANLNPNNINIVSFGQFIKRKSNLELISLVSKLPSNYHLTLIGSGKEKKLYESYIVANALGKRVTLLPFMKQNELLTYLRPYDCFISLSKEDIYGHMVNEALSAGLPVICSNKIVSAHKLVNKENGFIVDINDEKNIMDALNDFKNIKRENCLKTSYENTIEKMIESHLDILKD